MAISLQDIRNAARELGKITGSINNEEVLDIIFKKIPITKGVSSIINLISR